MTNFSPREIVSELDRFIVGQKDAKRAVAAIGSGGNYALAAAKALLDSPQDAEAIARRAMKIASEICVYTNENIVVETI